MRGAPVRDPRRIGKHVGEIIDTLLTPNGATNVRVYKTRHVQIVFNLGKHEFEIRTACTPRSDEHTIQHAKTYLMRQLEKRAPHILAELR